MSEKDNDLKRKLSWKRAFHLLKCVAIRKFRLKYHERLNKYERSIITKLPVVSSKEDFKETNLFQRINDLDENKLEILATKIISNIVDEIKSRSASSSSKSITPPQTPNEPKLEIKQKKPLIKTDNPKPIRVNKTRPETKIKIVQERAKQLPKAKQIENKTIRPKPKSKDIKHPLKQKLDFIAKVVGEHKTNPNKKDDLKDLSINPLRSHRPSLLPIEESFVELLKGNDKEFYKTQSEPEIRTVDTFLSDEQTEIDVRKSPKINNEIPFKDENVLDVIIPFVQNDDAEDNKTIGFNEANLQEKIQNIIDVDNENKLEPLSTVNNIENESKLNVEFERPKISDSNENEIKSENNKPENINEQKIKSPKFDNLDLIETKTIESESDNKDKSFISEKGLEAENIEELNNKLEKDNSLIKEENEVLEENNQNESEVRVFSDQLEDGKEKIVLDEIERSKKPEPEIKLEPAIDEKSKIEVDNKVDPKPKIDNRPRRSFSPILFSYRKKNLDNNDELSSASSESLDGIDSKMKSDSEILDFKSKMSDDTKPDDNPVEESSNIEDTIEQVIDQDLNVNDEILNTEIQNEEIINDETTNQEVIEQNEAELIREEVNEGELVIEETNQTQNELLNETNQETEEQAEEEEPVAEVETKFEEEEKLSKKAKRQEEKPKRPKKIEPPKMDPNFYYDYETMVFKPVISEESNFNENFLQLFHSFGYDCKKRSNLHLIDEETLIFSAGNLVQLLNIRTKEQRYLKTLSGGAVGAISVHPSRNFFAVGEKGNMPNINIFEYPSLKLYRILRQGTIKGYAYLDYNPTGNLLASLGSAPDYMLTIWDWKEEKIVLRTKAFSQDIFKVTFSKDLEGILTSAGTGHIKFWKMASTFTGFKLQGDIGKFGKTEISDIEGYAELPDGKVLSGSEWGNMLLWDGGLIQTEICRKKNKSCHTGTIQQITLNEGDIYTIGDDGSIRVWDFETIDTSEPSEEGVKLEIEPLNELKVGNNVALRSMVKDFSEESTIWYAQDSNGAIWKLDLGFSATSENPRQLFNYHSGCINGIECCPISHLFATTADDGSVKVYDYLTYEILCQKKFSKSGTSLKWLQTNVDPDGATIVAGFKDGVLRFLKLVPKNDKYELVLFEVFKPHTNAVTKIAIDSKNSLIATGSDDQTVFFFANKQNTRTPIGFVNLPSKVTYMTWTPADYEKNRLLVCMENGAVYEFDAPIPGSYDISKSYLIELKLRCRKFKFKSIKSFLRHEEELERKRIEEEARKKKEAEERRLRGIDEEEEKKKKEAEKKKAEEEGKIDEEENDEVKKPKEDEWKPFIPEHPSKICWALYSSTDTFWLSMDDYDAGYLYECKFLDEAQKAKMSPEKIDEPFRGVPVVRSDLTHSEDIPLTCMIFDKSKKYAVIGEKNGVIRINPMDENKKLEDIKHYWSYGYHDSDYGHVTNVCLSFDEKFLFSVGADSNIFGILFNSSQEDLEKAKKDKVKITVKTAVQDVADIDDPSAYSIEQAKQKSEHDKMIAIAEAKKADMRQKINGLRKLFKDLTIKNDQLVPRLKLSKNEFLLEESIKQQVINQINEKIDLTYKELAWQSEKCRLMLEKVQSKFKDVIDCDYIVVHSFDADVNVTTFRTVTLPKDMEAYKTELEKHYLIKLLEKQKTKENLENQGVLDINGSDDSESQAFQGLSAAEQMKKIFGKLRGNTAAKVERALKKMDERRLKRLKRKREWDELMKSKLPDDYENPDDVAKIKYAEENLGDFKLKSSDDYVVSENERMNVFKAVERLMLIKEFIHDNQMTFNSKVISLRDKKKNLVDEINRAIDRLEQIQFILAQQEEVPIKRPSMRPEELPEKKYEYTRERLIEFKKELEAKQNKSHEEESGSGGFGGFGATNNSNTNNNNSTGSQQKKVETKNALDKNSKFEGLKQLWHNKDSMSNLMKQSAQTKEIRLHYEQKQIIKSIEEKISLFNAELKVLRHEKSRVSVYLKNADLRHVTIFEEFLLLRDFEKTENELEQKLSMKKDEHVDMQSKLSEIQSKIDAKKKDIDKIDENLKHLFHSYTQMTHDETKYGDFLNKVYKRKIKRKKKVEGADEDEESEEESEDEDDDDEDLDNEDDDSEAEGREQLDLDICPSGLRQELFDQVCQLREKRLDYEEQVAEEKKLLEQFKKDQDGLVKKAKIIENGLRQAQTELENFQKEKQKKINSLDIIVTLSIDQIKFLSKSRMPADLSDALAFDAKNLDRLQTRIRELEVEKADEKKLFKRLRQRHLELIRDKKKMDEYVGKLDELCNKMMMDKYGKIVDLEKIELIAVNQQIEELKQRMAENETEHEKVMHEWLDKINNEKDESIELLKANTTRINEMVELLSDSKKLEANLDNKQRSLGQEMTSTSKKEMEERRRLHTLVQLQAQEVEALKAEIAILSRKGGHILPPTQPQTLAQS